MRNWILAAALLAAPAATAQVAPSQAGTSEVAATSIDPARLAIATRIAARVLPDGFYARMLGGNFSQLVGSLTKQAFDLPLREVVKAAGVPEAEAAKLSPATLRQVMEVIDPNYEKRNAVVMDSMMHAMIPVLTEMEPELRLGLAESYAQHFTLEQLSDVDRFFATPSGSAYAGESMALFMDPAYLQRMQGMMPKLLKALPAIMEQVKAKTADLPPPPDYKNMTAEQRAKVAALLGLPAPSKGARK